MAKKPIARILCHNADGISKDRLALQELLHSLDIDIALICETKLAAGFVWRNPGLQRFTNTKFDSSVESVSGSKVKKVIKT